MLDFGFYNMDCMEGMKQFPDKYFELAIVDPPYGLDFGKFNRTEKTATGERFKANRYHQAEWDNQTPSDTYFNELFRVSKNQIIWGGNYFKLPPTKEFIFWYKHQPVSNFSDGEYAWTSFKGVAKCFDYQYFGNVNSEKDRIHPTQKPVALYTWLLNNYAKKGDKILDTHVGSASSLIACHKLGFEYVGFELDKDYYEAALKRLNAVKNQVSLFDLDETLAKHDSIFDAVSDLK
jgi:site-specific DNA-methyltransferase (adenine-specific)